MTKQLGIKKLLKITIISMLVTTMLITSNPFLADIKKVFAEDEVVIESTTGASSDVTIAATPGHSAFPTPIQRGTTTDLTLEAILGSAPHHGNQIRVWDPGLSDEQPLPGIGCTNFANDTVGPGEKWILMADSSPPNGSFETIVQYDLPEVGDSITLTGFGNGGTIFVIASNFDSLGTDPDLVPSIFSGADFAWVDDLGVALTDDTSVIGTYKFGSCGTEGVAGTQNFRGEVTFDVVASCTELTKEADPTSGPWPLTVTYTYEDTNCGQQGDSPLTNVTIRDIGEDANNNGILNAGEDKNANGILEPGCDPVPGGAVDTIRVAGDTDRDGIRDAGESWIADGDLDNDGDLDPAETWTFECTATINPVGMFNNTAFARGTICLDADCNILDGIHTGDPACQSEVGILCDPAERNSTKVTVERQTPQVTTQSNPSGNILPGAAVTDKATVNSVPPGLIPAPTGTVLFFLCGPGLANPVTPAGCPVGGTQIGGAVALAGTPRMATSAAASGATTDEDGKYCWRAQYSGDTNYNPASHTNSLINNSGGECFTVGQPPGTIIIIKDTIPNDARNFEFTETIPLPGTSFTLDDDSNGALSNTKTFSNVVSGTFEVREIEDSDFPLRDIRCRGDSTFTANGGSTVRDLNNAKVTITINSGTVTCTFINGVIPPPCVGGVLSAIQPEDSISMTTVVSKQNSNVIAKTVHAEKQIFDCFTTQGDVPVIADVTIIAEIYENMNTQTTISKQVEVITCVKRINTDIIIDCSVMIPSTDSELVRFCRESPLEEPQEMNTVAKASINGGTNQKGIVKTIEAQKEVFLCNLDNAGPDEKKVDIVVFTETWEDLSLLPSNPLLPRPPIETLRCVIKIDTVTVESCQFREFPL